ncbi:MAG: hypothetical protein ACOYMN_13385 [Roseimicrobium sp.]
MKLNPLSQEALAATANSQRNPAPLPVWVRLPPNGTAEPFTGLRRSAIYRLIEEGKVRSAVIRSKRGALRGVRVLHLGSVLDYLDSCADEPRADEPSLETA